MRLEADIKPEFNGKVMTTFIQRNCREMLQMYLEQGSAESRFSETLRLFWWEHGKSRRPAKDAGLRYPLHAQ
jgi:hypothetical protein